jgi:hypothetical protein
LFPSHDPEVASKKQYRGLHTTFNNASYENMNGLYSIVRKLDSGRNMENISTGNNRFTCSSLIAHTLEEIIPKQIHYSQHLPDDFDKYFR